MQLKVKTEKLKEMVSRAIKGASNNKLIPITSLMAIELKGGTLTLTTTDATNYLYIKEDNVDGDDFYVVVPVDIFSRLVMRMTCESVELEIMQNSLEVRGNGKYNIELPMDENGQYIKYPDPISEVDLNGDGTEIQNTTFHAILNSIKPSLAVTMEIPCYTGYYVGEKIVGTDTYKIASMDVSITSEPMLIAPETMNLLDVMTSEKIQMNVFDNVIVFTSPDCAIYTTKMEGIDDFAISAISEHIDSEFDSMCKVSKSALLQILDRLSLFVGAYDKNGINLTFTNEGLQISSKSSSGVELLDYIESDNFTSFTCMIDIMALAMQVKAQVSDAVTIYYGKENAIKMVDGNLTQIVALMENVE